MAHITPEAEKVLIKAKQEADKHFSDHPEINVERLAKESREAMLFCSTVIASSPNYNVLLFYLFRKEIMTQIQVTGRRYVYFFFASANRLKEWVSVGDCSHPISIELATEEQANKHLSNIYPKTVEACRNNKERVLIALGSSMRDLVNVYSATAVDINKFSDDSTSKIKQQYPIHSKLQGNIILLPDK